MNAPFPSPSAPSTPAPIPLEAQIGIGIALLYVIATVCWVLLPFTGHTFAAIVFLLFVVLAGTRFDRGPVLGMAIACALVWNFVFIPPRFTLHIEKPADVAMFGLFFVVALGMGHLITRLRQREEALEKHHQERENLLSAKHHAELAAKAERLHRTLLDSVSHELKTPITVILTALEGMGTGNPYAVEIDTATRRLQRIVENLLEITRVESDAVKPAPDWCEIGDVLEGATTLLQRELSRHTLDITGVGDLPLLKLDSRILAQALANVLHNASLHAPAGTRIEIHTTLANQVLEIRVRDHGPGIPPGLEDRLFGKFYRAPGASAGGTGLGLAISRGLMRAMHGDITARTHPDGGAEFALTLPAQTCNA
jgi:K+-sensing histidine kinase KdpD